MICSVSCAIIVYVFWKPCSSPGTRCFEYAVRYHQSIIVIVGYRLRYYKYWTRVLRLYRRKMDIKMVSLLICCFDAINTYAIVSSFLIDYKVHRFTLNEFEGSFACCFERYGSKLSPKSIKTFLILTVRSLKYLKVNHVTKRI